MNRISNALKYAGLFMVVTLVVIFVDVIISKTGVGKMKGYVEFKESVKKWFGNSQ